MTGISGCFLYLMIAATSQAVADDQQIIDLLRDAQVTNRAAFRQGRVKVRFEIDPGEAKVPAVLDGEIIWIEGDSLLKFAVIDPDEVYFPNKEGRFGGEGNFILRTRDGIEIFNPKTNQLSSRPPKRSSIDPYLNLDPWLQLFHCCSPDAVPPAGRAWKDMIGPHPAMKVVMETSKFRYETRSNGDILQERTDADGSVGEILFAAGFDYQVASFRQRLPGGREQQSGIYRYEKSGRVALPVESRFVHDFDPSKPARTFIYKFSNWNLRDTVPPAAVSIERFRVMARGLRDSRRVSTSGPQPGVAEARLRELSRRLSEAGFAAP